MLATVKPEVLEKMKKKRKQSNTLQYLEIS